MKLEELKKISAHFQPPFTPEHTTQLQDYLRAMGLDPNNLYQELEMSYRFVQAHRDTSYSNAMVSLHSHSFYEILCCRNTCKTEYLVGTERYRLQKGDIIIVPPGVSHRPLLPEKMDEPYIRDVLWVSMEFVDTLLRIFPHPDFHLQNTGSLLRTAGTQWEHISELLRIAVKESESQTPGWDSIVIGNAIAFMAYLQRALLAKDTAPVIAEKPDLLVRVLTYIEENLSGRITLEDTAQHFYVSKSTISQLFRNKMGVSFYRCVTQRRLIAAKVLIAQKHALESVAEQTGFTDYSAFYRAFKQEYGINPRQYRNLQAETPSEGI